MAQLPFLNGATLATIRANINSMFVELYAAIGSKISTLAGATDVATANLPTLNAPTAAALGTKMSRMGVWNLTTNVATAPDGSTFTPTSGVYPSDGCDFLFCTGTAGATQVIDTSTAHIGDYATMNAALAKWIINSASGATIAATSLPLVGDGAGNAIAATYGINVVAPPSIQCNVAIGNAPSGTFTTNGAFSLGTGIVSQSVAGYYAEGCWLYFPANGITGSNAAGFYWCVFTSTTVGTAFNTIYTPGTNTGTGSWHIPSAPTAFSGTTGSAFTGVTGAITTHSLGVPANAMGPNGIIEAWVGSCNNNSAGAKVVQGNFGGAGIGYSSSAATLISSTGYAQIRNQGRTDRQISRAANFGGLSSVSNGRSNDTTVNQTLTMTTSVSTATDYNLVDSLRWNILYGS